MEELGALDGVQELKVDEGDEDEGGCDGLDGRGRGE